MNNLIIKKAGNFVLAAALAFNLLFSVNVSRAMAAVSNAKAQEIKKELQPLMNVVNMYYYEKADTEKMLREVLEEANETTDIDSISRSFIRKLNDPYSEYYTADELENFNSSMKGQYYGIGVEIAKDKKTGGIIINKVFPNSPAEKAKLKKGDIILRAADKDLTNLDLTEASAYVKGEKGTKITLTILRGKSEKKIKVERNEVRISSVFYKTYEKDKIGYIRVTSFLEKTASEFVNALDKLETKGISGLVIDLRDNGGGLVDSAHKMLDRILPDGKEIYSFGYKNGGKDRYKTLENPDKTFDYPMLILMNKGSASASELFAGALKDHFSAEVVGEVSYGKGVAQSLLELRDKENRIKCGIKLTTIKYYLPNGESINKIGIEPDYKVADDKKTAEDEQLETALKELREMID